MARTWKETAEKRDKDCFQEWFQLAKVKMSKDGEGSNESIGMKVLHYCYYFTWDKELELAWFVIQF